MTEPVRPLFFAAILLGVILPAILFTPAASAPPNSKSSVPSQAGIELGAKLYRDNCLSCHGSQAHGNSMLGIPSLAAQNSTYLLKQLLAFTDSQRDSPEMHRRMAVQALESPRIWRGLVDYLSTLPANTQPLTGNGAHLDQGRSVYQELCIGCHGRYAEGKIEGAVPALRGQHYTYLTRQLRAFATLHRDSMEFPVLKKIARLSPTERDAVADYASRLPADK